MTAYKVFYECEERDKLLYEILGNIGSRKFFIFSVFDCLRFSFQMSLSVLYPTLVVDLFRSDKLIIPE